MHPRRAALIYDFDGTLAPGNIQEHGFLKHLNIDPGQFWTGSNSEAREQDADQILVYMRHMLHEARLRGLMVTRETLGNWGAETPFFAGVESWFERINRFAQSYQIQLEHYVISSGLKEMIEGCKIAHHLKFVFASTFLYDEAGHACWPALAINYTGKTQYLFRINKGIENCWDHSSINRFVPESQRPLPFERMIFLGDGETDIPSMKMMRHQKGYAIAVFDPEKWEALQTHIAGMIAGDRVDFVAPADYRQGSQLEVTVQGLLRRMAGAFQG